MPTRLRRALSAAVLSATVLTVLAVPVANAAPTPTTVQPRATCSTRFLPLPDPSCTPGVTNPAVTQSTIGSTICVSGWTATVRPPTSYTNPLKVQGIKDYGYSDTNAKDSGYTIAGRNIGKSTGTVFIQKTF